MSTIANVKIRSNIEYHDQPSINVNVGGEQNSSHNETQPLLGTTSNIRTRQLVTTNTIINSSADSVCDIISDSNNSMPNLKSDSKKDRSSNDEIKSVEIDNFQAFLTLFLIFLINATTLASLKVYGIIFERIVAEGYYTREQASWPISTASTIQNLAGFLTPILALRLSWRSIELIQAIMFVIANVGAYFSNSLLIDILCLSLIQGIACSIRYNMNVAVNNEYFQKYRATAMGISLAGASCGVLFLKPIVVYVLDSSGQLNFRNAYLALALIMAPNIIFGMLIRKPRNINNNRCNESNQNRLSINENEHTSIRQESINNENNLIRETNNNSLRCQLLSLLSNPSIHCIWIMQTIYFYISRTYTIFIIDYGVGKGFNLSDSRSLLNFWIYGEIGGRLLLGGLVDYKLLSLKWNIIVVNLILGFSGFALLLEPSKFMQQIQQKNISEIIITHSPFEQEKQFSLEQDDNMIFYWTSGAAIATTAAMSSLLNMLIVPLGQEYLGKKNVSWAFALGSIVTGLLLFLRPVLIGISRDKHKSYDLLIIVLSSAPCIYGVLFLLVEPLLNYYRFRIETDNRVG